MAERVKLADIRARAEKATPGPWNHWPEAGAIEVTSRHPVPDGPFGTVICGSVKPKGGWGGRIYEDNDEPDAEFIAHARQDVPTLLAALDAVLAAHVPNEHCFHEHEGAPCCRDCEQIMPCSTRRAIESVIDLGGSRE